MAAPHAEPVNFREALRACREVATEPQRHCRTVHGVPVYASAELVNIPRADVFAELASVLAHGAGVFVLEAAVQADVVDRATEVLFAIIDDERAAGTSPGDHFAKPGANNRIWNALEKLAVTAPDVFCEYYESEAIALACEAWLGPWYQVTSQINVVNPGGQAQQPHCDYHLGFQVDADIARFPAHVHALSPMLTLQGAVAHCAMPVETGPTTYLPHSQKLPGVYGAWRNSELIEAYGELSISIPLDVGDAVFFNPSLVHAAGTNRTADVRRMANLLQVSSAMGRAMESVDRDRISKALFPELSRFRDAGWSSIALGRVIAASAEGYPFPTNLDLDQPIGRLTPLSQADIVTQALAAGSTLDELTRTLGEYEQRRRTSPLHEAPLPDAPLHEE